MPRVGVVGHVEWVDFIPIDCFPQPGDIAHAEGSFGRPAGGGGVVAAVLAEQGAEVEFFTSLGRDWYGHEAESQLIERGVRVHVAWRERPSRRAVTLLEPDGERTIITIGRRLEPLGEDQLPWERLRDFDGVYFTAGDVASFVHCQRAGVVVASARGRHALETDGRAIDALVFSARDRDENDWARRVAQRARLLVQTNGVQGGRWWGESSGAWEAVEPPGEARDAYGCGDSFAAGLTLALAAGESITDAVALGASLGARCVTRAGAP
jgi:ribokinase